MYKYRQLDCKNKFFREEALTYPIKSIEIIDDHLLKVSCENEKDADIFQRVTYVISSCNGGDSEPLDYTIERDNTGTNFYLSGNDVDALFPLFMSTKLLSGLLLEEVMREISDEKKQAYKKEGGMEECTIL